MERGKWRGERDREIEATTKPAGNPARPLPLRKEGFRRGGRGATEDGSIKVGKNPLANWKISGMKRLLHQESSEAAGSRDPKRSDHDPGQVYLTYW